jgi:hypothetical protein
MEFPVQKEKNIGASNVHFTSQIHSLGPSRSEGCCGEASEFKVNANAVTIYYLIRGVPVPEASCPQ